MTPVGRRTAVGGLIVLLLALALTISVLAPWWNTGTTPVELVLHAPADTEIRLHWDEDEAPLRMVPAGDEVNEWNWFWVTELPPRPSYSLAIEFGESRDPIPFAELKIWKLSPRKSILAHISAADPEAAWVADGLAIVEKQADRVVLDLSNGGTIRFTEPIDLRPDNYIATLWLPLLNLLVLGILAFGLIGSGWRFPSALAVRTVKWGERESIAGIAVFILAAGVHWHLVATSVPDYWPADSTSYMDKALSLAYGQTFDTGGYEYELNRTPGYPLMVAAALKWIEPSLNATVHLQTSIALLCFAALFWQLHRFIRPSLFLIAMPLVLWSPPLVWASRQIASESLFVSFWILATTSGIGFWTTRGTRKKGWIYWGVFSIAVGCATFVRANGILLLVLPGCALIGVAVRGWYARPGIMRAAVPDWRHVVWLLVPFVAVVVVLVAWSWRNAENRGYARPSDLAPVVAANAPFNAGMLDVRVFEDEEEYAWVLQERFAQGYFFPGWSLRHHRFLEISNEWKDLDDTTIGKLADSLESFVTGNNAIIPWQARLVAWWRVLGWGLWVPEYGAFTQDSLQSDYHIHAKHETEWLGNTVQQRLDWLARNRDEGVTFPRLSVEEGHQSMLTDSYNRLVPYYPSVYRALVIAGIFALAWAVYRRQFLPALFLAPFFVNMLLNVYFLYVIGRYLQVLDAMLILGCLTAAPKKLLKI